MLKIRNVNQMGVKAASFNMLDTYPALYCSKHKLTDMVDIYSKSCEFENCKKNGFFNYNGIRKRKFCSEHKLKDMIDMRKMKKI